MDRAKAPHVARLSRRISAAVLVLGFIATGLLILSSLELLRQQRDNARFVGQAIDVFSAITVLSSDVATSGGTATVDRDIAALRAVSIGGPSQRAALDHIRELSTQGPATRAAPALAALVAYGAEQRRLLDLRSVQSRQAIRYMIAMIVACGAVLAFSALSQGAILRGRVRARRALAELSRLNAELEGRIAARTAELAESMTRQRGYFDYSPVGMYVIGISDSGGYVHDDMNPAAEAIYGLARQDVIGRLLPEVWPEQIVADTEVKFALCRNEKRMVRYSVLRHLRGRVRTLDVQLTPLLDAQGAARSILTCVMDVTEQREAERMVVLHAEREAARQAELAAAQAERRRELEVTNASLDRLARHLAKARDLANQASLAKSQFVASMSHELRTPLNGILGYAQLLWLEGGLTEAQAVRVDAMLRSGRHLLELVTNVLDVSQIEAGRVELTLAPLDAAHVCGACLDLLRPAAMEKGLTLALDAPEGLPAMLADQGRLRQILLNLLSNAIKFTTEGEVCLRVRAVSVEAEAVRLRIEVADTGPGIPPDRSAQLFDVFGGVIDPPARLGGAGFGLAIARRLVELMKGRIGYADHVPQGSVFWIELPAVSPVALAALAESAAAALPPPQARLRALVVDDVLMNRDIATAFLRASGHDSFCVGSGEEAVAAAAREDFDLILMDVRMPGMDGLEATRRIRQLPGGRGEVPIVALTAYAFLDQVEECRQAGMDAHVVKPFDHPTLIETVQRAVLARRQEPARPAASAPVAPDGVTACAASDETLLALRPGFAARMGGDLLLGGGPKARGGMALRMDIESVLNKPI